MALRGVLYGLTAAIWLVFATVATAQSTKPGPLNSDISQSPKRAPMSRGEVQLSFAPVVKRAAPAVVNIYSRRIIKDRPVSPFFKDFPFPELFGRRFGAPRRRVQRSLGSGVVVRANGVVVTNNHVIKGGTEIQVVLSDGREFRADVVLSDKKTDLAILKIDTKGEQLPALKLSNSDDLEVGDLVLAIGNPFGVGQTVTSGIVSALARTQAGISDFQFFIQTDAAINPGNSGGALINMRGQLAGINTAIFSRSGGSNGIGFAIPANMVRVVVESSRVGGKVRRPWIGARLQRVSPEIAESIGLRRPRGAMIKQVHRLSPLGRSGLRTGDVVLKIGDFQVQSPQEFRYRYATRQIGGRAMLTYFRNGRRLRAEVKLISPPETPPRNISGLEGRNPFAGATVANLSPALSEEAGFVNLGEGVVILRSGRGPARRGGLRRGDVILEVEGVQINRVNQLLPLLRERHRSWHIVIRRRGKIIEGDLKG